MRRPQCRATGGRVAFAATSESQTLPALSDDEVLRFMTGNTTTILTYGALFYVVDLEAVKAGISGRLPCD